MAICIPKEYIDEAKKVIQSAASSVERTNGLTKVFGENPKLAQDINLLYEKQLLLKNQKNTIERFVDSINGVSLEKKAKLKEQLAQRMKNRTETIQNDELLSIAKDIFDRKYDLDIKPQDVQVLNKLKTEAYELGKKIEGTPSGSPERMAQAEKVTLLSEYIDGLVNPEQNMGLVDTVKEILKKTGQRYEGKTSWEKVLETGKLASEIATSAVYKSVQASIDASFALRQGFKVLASDPVAWKTNLVEAFKPFSKITTPKDKWQVMHAFKVKLVANELYNQALDSKLAIGVIEEFFPTAIAEKVPVLGNLFKASNEAFTIFSQGARMDMFENMIKHAQSSGVKVTPEISKELAMLANSISGRGNLGQLERVSGVVNKLLYSGRFIKSQVDTFYLPFKPGLSPVAREIAMKSSLRTLGMFASLMATASLFTDVEVDPRSSKFGKMKVPGSKDTWVDISGGLGSYITLASRIATQESKSSMTNRVTKLNSGKFGSKTAYDVALDFLGNKLAPAPSAFKSYLKGQDFQGNKPTLTSTAVGLAKPISVGNMVQIFQDEETGPAFVSTMFDLLGAGQTNYDKFKK